MKAMNSLQFSRSLPDSAFGRGTLILSFFVDFVILLPFDRVIEIKWLL